MKKYIFLDIDGVLNTERNIKLLREQGKQTSDKYGFLFDPLSVANLASILYQTSAEIIISSTLKRLILIIPTVLLVEDEKFNNGLA